MKQESVVKYVLRITLTLLLIAAMVAAAMALVNKITKPIIARNAEEKVQQAIGLVLPGGYDSQITDYADPSGIVSRVFKGPNGYAVEVQPIGFDSAVTMMVGVAPDGSVLQICVVSHTETKGLGEVAASSSSAGVSFRQQFVGTSGNVLVTKDGGIIDAITGATVTSRAVCSGVNAAVDCVLALSQGGAA